MLLYTDGLTEAFSPADELFGLERLHQLVQAHDCQSARGLLAAVETAVDEFMAEAPAADDMTLLALKRLA